ncbi:MAG: DNA repair exonuclease [Caldilineaceae bacterium]|nr:DNA repair exonuclease [Caldilineaceae bacterium]
MQTRFLHFADVHLGFRQYNQSERYNDFARAYLAVIQAAIDAQVDFVILAGDLFEKRSIDALTLNQAMRGLERLAEAGIPVIAVEGNHERAYYDEQVGWLRFLALRDLLILLHPTFHEGKLQLAPYTRRTGAYIDPAPGVRVYGMGWMGSATAQNLERYADALAGAPRDGIEYAVFVSHAGVEGVLDGASGGLSMRQWSVLRPFVDYLALGHIHKPYEFEDWIYNPGSLENCAISETAWPARGYYLVEVDTERPRAAPHRPLARQSPPPFRAPAPASGPPGHARRAHGGL